MDVRPAQDVEHRKNLALLLVHLTAQRADDPFQPRDNRLNRRGHAGQQDGVDLRQNGPLICLLLFQPVLEVERFPGQPPVVPGHAARFPSGVRFQHPRQREAQFPQHQLRLRRDLHGPFQQGQLRPKTLVVVTEFSRFGYHRRSSRSLRSVTAPAATPWGPRSSPARCVRHLPRGWISALGAADPYGCSSSQTWRR